jgi:hypothetical protein
LALVVQVQHQTAVIQASVLLQYFQQLQQSAAV